MHGPPNPSTTTAARGTPPAPPAPPVPPVPVDVEAAAAAPPRASELDSAGRGLTRRWRIRVPGRDAIGRISLAERILAARGRTDPADVAAFLDPRLTGLPNPATMPGATAAAERLVAAVRNGEPVAIYGDYDVDGMTATAVLFHVIRAIKPDADLRSYVPHRLEEGYGLNGPALERLAADGVKLVLTVDCGITAVAEVGVARAAGLDVIVTDHHELPPDGGPLPDATLVHPRLPGSEFPCGDVCGAGVAFMLAWRFCQAWAGSDRVGAVARDAMVHVLPLVALGTIADVVPLTGANRVLTTFGLRAIRSCPIEGLRALITESRLDGADIDDEKVGFVLAPRLNACGRMGHARDAVRMLCEADADEARVIAKRLAALNTERQATERQIFDQAAAMAHDAGMTRDDRRVIVLAHEDWHPGVVGIVCSRLVERFGRPAILMQRDGDTLKGSARSIDGYSIHAGLAACAGHLTRFGGHDMAAGLSLPADGLDAFVRDLTAHANASIPKEELIPRLLVDVDATIESLTIDTVRGVQRLGPFGRGNRRPVVRLEDVRVHEARVIGSEGRHLALTVTSATAGGGRGRFRSIWWGAAEHADRLVPGLPVDLAIEPKINEWRGTTRVEGQIRDVRVRLPGT